MTLRWSAEKWHKNRMCKLFGHRGQGWKGSPPYLRAVSGPVDGINEHHITLTCLCDRCGSRLPIAYIHESGIRRVIRNSEANQ